MQLSRLVLMVRHIMETVSDEKGLMILMFGEFLFFWKPLSFAWKLVELRKNARLSTEGFLDCVLAVLVSS